MSTNDDDRPFALRQTEEQHRRGCIYLFLYFAIVLAILVAAVTIWITRA